MRRAGLWVIFIPLGVIFLFWGAGVVLALLHTGVYLGANEAEHLMIVSVFLAVPGAVLWLAGWIVEGFAKDAF